MPAFIEVTLSDGKKYRVNVAFIRAYREMIRSHREPKDESSPVFAVLEMSVGEDIHTSNTVQEIDDAIYNAGGKLGS